MPTYSIPAPRPNTQSTDEWADLAKSFMTQPGFASQYMDGIGQTPPFNPEGSARAAPLAMAPAMDRDLIAGVLTAEGAGATDMGYIADVIANRVASEAYPNDWRGAILQPGQFSALNAITGYAGGEGANDVWRNPSAEAYAIADSIINGTFQGGATGGALNYYQPQHASPAWGGDHFRSLPGSTHVFGNA